MRDFTYPYMHILAFQVWKRLVSPHHDGQPCSGPGEGLSKLVTVWLRDFFQISEGKESKAKISIAEIIRREYPATL